MKASRRLLTRAAILFIALLFASAGFVSLWRLMEEREHSMRLFRTGSWNTVQAEIEVLRLTDAVSAFYHGENPNRAEALRRLEIFWSRIPLLIEGEEGKLVRQRMGAEAIRRIEEQLPRIEQDIAGLTPGDNQHYRAIRAELDRVQATLHETVLKVLAPGTVAEGKERLERSYTQIFVAFTLVIVCGGALLVMLLHELRESSRLLIQSRQAAKAAAEANSSKSRFLAAASHDLRQPLNALSLLVGLLRTRVKDPPSVDLIDRCEESLIRIAKQLDSYLDITKLDTGRIAVDRTVVPIGTLLHRVGDMFRETAERKGLRLRIVDSRLRTVSDVFLLERTLANLVSNAVRYTEKGSVLIGCRRRGDEIRIDVIDTGPGIAPEHQSEIFEEFFQIANRERAHAEGHGLGLSIVRRLLSVLGHKLDFESTLGRGSRFSIVVAAAGSAKIPDWESSAGPDTPAPLISTGDKRQRHSKHEALIVEDDALIAMSMALMMEDFGWDTVTASSAEQAVELVTTERLRPDLIIADYRLSGQTGIEAINELRNRLGTPVPACIITGDIDPEVKAEALDQDIGYLSKPITTGDLRSIVIRAEHRKTSI